MTTQPRKAGEFSFLLFSWLCHRKWLVLFSLKFQRSNQQSTLTIDSTKGKTGEKGCILPCCGDETTTYYDTAKYKK